MPGNTKPDFFADQQDFRRWLEKNHQSEKELLVGFYKVGSPKPSMTWSESVDQALCFGWIDGIRKSIDHESYTIRFTPRKPKSIWSAINIKKIGELTEKHLIRPAGIAAFEKREEKRSAIYTYEKAGIAFDSETEKKFKANKAAWSFFESTAPGYQKIATNWVMSAKQEGTKRNRLETLMSDCEFHRKIKSQRY